MTHRRRTPCCEIEAFRYLNEHDYVSVPLDAVRLANALRHLPDRHAATVEEFARAIAAEYARLESEK